MAPLSILAPTRYPWRFNSPRASRHDITISPFVPFNKISKKIEGVTLFLQKPGKSFDLVHAFNRIPIGNTPYLIGFESHLPRAFSLEKSSYFRLLRKSLASPRCRGIIGISHHAEKIFREMHEASEFSEELMAKFEIRYPNLVVPDEPDPGADLPLDPLRVVFVGSHFARKGGCVAVRLAELAEERSLPLEITIISKLEMGGGIWTDPLRDGYFDKWKRRLAHPFIEHFDTMPNAQVIELLRRSHFSLLTTFGDTFGYSAIESMAHHCPVIATRQGALDEFIEDNVSGILLDLDTEANGEWIYSSYARRGSPEFEKLFDDEIERLALQTLERLEQLIADPAHFRAMRTAAWTRAREMFDAGDANLYWDARYDSAVAAG